MITAFSNAHSKIKTRLENHTNEMKRPGGSRIWQWGGGGARFLMKCVTYTSEASYERSEYKTAGGPGGGGGRCKPPEKKTKIAQLD